MAINSDSDVRARAAAPPPSLPRPVPSAAAAAAKFVSLCASLPPSVPPRSLCRRKKSTIIYGDHAPGRERERLQLATFLCHTILAHARTRRRRFKGEPFYLFPPFVSK